jgi:RNA polymerase sigma factor (sigma-70 family)
MSNGRSSTMRTLSAAPAGAAWCFASLQARKEALVAAATRILRCRALAEDVVQDVWLRLLSAPPPPGIGPQGAYVARMVRNLAIDRARRLRFEARTFAALESGIAAPAPGADAEGVVAARQALRRAQAAVEGLPEPVRTVFRLHRVDGVPQKDIAARLGVSRALVCGLVRRGHERCRAAVEGDCPLAEACEQQHGAEAVGERLGHGPARQHPVEAVELR